MAVEFRLSPGMVRSFRRLSYTPWHALAEFVDNSTQSYFNHRAEVDESLAREGSRFEVVIEYTHRDRSLTVRDNAMGMSVTELERAMTVGEPPSDPTGRSRYGMGLKTAASWFGEEWTVETRRLGEASGHSLTVNVERVASGASTLAVREVSPSSLGEHYTLLTIRRMYRALNALQRDRIREFLRSMYQQDIRDNVMKLVWMHEALEPERPIELATDLGGQALRKAFDFSIGGKQVHGWAGVLARGGRPKAGFAVFHSGRVIRGAPQAWRPHEIFGQVGIGRNDLLNQRLVGEVHLDDFAVTHTKDDIQWADDEEQEVGKRLKVELAILIRAANEIRFTEGLSPTRTDRRKAALQLQQALISDDAAVQWMRLSIPGHPTLHSRNEAVIRKSTQRPPDFQASVDGISLSGYLALDLAPDESYVSAGMLNAGLIQVVINLNHPHVRGMKAAVLVDHLQHCTFQALVEWRLHGESQDGGDLVATFLRDALLRIDVAQIDS
jgi:Histidine kinase-, DNA gyrase B-, and HSP90-like ATPase